MLKNSDRNCIEKRSVIGMFLKTERLYVLAPGPKVVVGRYPKAAVPVKGSHPVGESGIGARLAPNLQGCWKAFGFPNQYTLPSGRVWIPSLALCPLTIVSKQPEPAEVPFGQFRVIGWPPWRVTIHCMLHPPTNPFSSFPASWRKCL